jgi:hypothetical protein
LTPLQKRARISIVFRKNLGFIALFTLTTLFGCAISPGARLVPKGNLEIGSELAVIIGSFKAPGIPVLPNLGLNVRYGLTDRLNIGGSIYPFYLTANKTLGIEPFFAGSIFPHGRFAPALLAYLETPIFFNFTQGKAFAFPLGGLAVNYEFARLIPYACWEFAVDPDANGRYRDLHANARIGVSRRSSRGIWTTIELGLHDMERRSFITNQGVGFPCVQLGVSFPIRKKP